MPGHANRGCGPLGAGEKWWPLRRWSGGFLRTGRRIFAAAAKGLLAASMFFWPGGLPGQELQHALLPASRLSGPAQQTLPPPEPAGSQNQEPNHEGKVWIRLQNGRQWIGQLDQRTSGQELWLRMGSEKLTIIRPISWEQVAAIHLDGQPIPVPFLQQLLDVVVKQFPVAHDVSAGGKQDSSFHLCEEAIQRLPPSLREFVHRRQAGETPPVPHRSGRIVLEGEPAETEAPGRTTAWSHSARSTEDISEKTARIDRSSRERVASLSFDAWLGQWDADAEADGLIVQILAQGAEGQPVPVRGMLEIVLVIPPRGAGWALDQKSHRQRWVHPVRPEDFSPLTGTAQYRCPFGSAQNHPEWNLALAGYGAITAQLTVPGQGTFSATADGIRVRPFSPVRDRLQQSTGQRIFSWESPQP